MNRQEILTEIAELKEKLNNLEKMYASLTPSNKRWRAEIGDDYCYIENEGSICADSEHGHTVDTSRYIIGNYFETKEEAEFELERLKVIAELKEWATPADNFDWKSLNTKYIMVCNPDRKIVIDFYTSYQFSDLCFMSREVAENAIKAVGKERIVKYYFRR